MKRVMIVGQPGSGKSTLARAMGELTGLPVFHIDHIHWKPGWVERSKAEKTPLCAEVHARPEWIFEGGNSATWPERLARCDTLIWLDLPVGIRLARVLWRSWRHRGRSRPDMPEGCTEQFSWEFYRWIWETRHSSRLAIERLVAGAPAEKTVLRLTSGRQARDYLAELRDGGARTAGGAAGR